MVQPSKLFGRLGNQMFQMAALKSIAINRGIDHYFQDPKWFEANEGQIKEMFSEGIGDSNSFVSIHVRRGDYVNNPFYVDLTKTDYYQRAISMFPDSKFLVFSDDIEWCKEYFKGNKFFFSERNNELEDMNLMAACEHNIIANSSFSWWAAYLNKNTCKEIIAPKEWYADGVERTVCPSSWIRI